MDDRSEYIYIYVLISTWPSTISHLLFLAPKHCRCVQRVDRARNSHRRRAAQITAGVAAIKSDWYVVIGFSDKAKTLLTWMIWGIPILGNLHLSSHFE